MSHPAPTLPSPAPSVGPSPAAAVPAVPRVRSFSAVAPPRLPLRSVVAATLTAAVALSTLVLVGELSGHVLLVPSLAGSMALVAGAPHLPLSQPRNVVAGQTVSAVLGVVVGLLSHSIWAAAIAGSLSLGVMLLLRVAHSPACATAVLATMSTGGEGWFVVCVALGAVGVVVAGVLRSKAVGGVYPTYW